MKKILNDAKKGKYAVGAFNIVNQMTAKAAVEAAEQLKTPIILQTSVKTVKQFGMKEMMCFLKPIAEKAEIDVAIHLDHSTDVDFTLACLEKGWSSVMYDGSKLLLSKNIQNTRKIVDAAKKYDATVEGELGAIVGVEDDIVVEEGNSALANPDDCREYLEKTQVDAFAPAVGTAHGVYKGAINIDYALFKEINGFSRSPLVLHGGTGLSTETFHRLIALGAAKVNISTAIKIAYCQGMCEYTKENPKENDPLKLDDFVKDKVKAVVTEHIRLFSLLEK